MKRQAGQRKGKEKGNHPQEDTQNLMIIGGVWYLRAMVNGTTIKQSLRTSNLAEARILRDARLAWLKSTKDEKTMLQSVRRQLDGITAEEERQRKEENLGELLSVMWRRYESSPARVAKAVVLQMHRHRWEAFVAWLDDTHPMTLHSHQVTRQIAQEYADYLWMDRNFSASNYNRYIATARLVFDEAMDRDDDLNNPFARIRKAPEKQNRHEIFNEDELSVLFSDDDAEFVRFCAIGLYTTQRVGSAKNLKWEQFTDDLTRLYASHNKTNADGSLIVPQELKEILERVPPTDRHGFLCPTYAAHKTAYVCTMFQRKLDALGIVSIGDKPERGSRRVCVHGYHSFRHTGITRALRNGANPAGVKKLAGQSATATQERYTHMGMEDAGRAAALIGRVEVRKKEEKPAEG